MTEMSKARDNHDFHRITVFYRSWLLHFSNLSRLKWEIMNKCLFQDLKIIYSLQKLKLWISYLLWVTIWPRLPSPLGRKIHFSYPTITKSLKTIRSRKRLFEPYKRWSWSYIFLMLKCGGNAFTERKIEESHSVRKMFWWRTRRWRSCWWIFSWKWFKNL